MHRNLTTWIAVFGTMFVLPACADVETTAGQDDFDAFVRTVDPDWEFVTGPGVPEPFAHTEIAPVPDRELDGFVYPPEPTLETQVTSANLAVLMGAMLGRWDPVDFRVVHLTTGDPDPADGIGEYTFPDTDPVVPDFSMMVLRQDEPGVGINRIIQWTGDDMAALATARILARAQVNNTNLAGYLVRGHSAAIQGGGGSPMRNAGYEVQLIHSERGVAGFVTSTFMVESLGVSHRADIQAARYDLQIYGGADNPMLIADIDGAFKDDLGTFYRLKIAPVRPGTELAVDVQVQ